MSASVGHIEINHDIDINVGSDNNLNSPNENGSSPTTNLSMRRVNSSRKNTNASILHSYTGSPYKATRSPRSRRIRSRYPGPIIFMTILMLFAAFNIFRKSQIDPALGFSNYQQPPIEKRVTQRSPDQSDGSPVPGRTRQEVQLSNDAHSNHHNANEPPLLGMENFEPCTSLLKANITTQTIDAEFMFWWDGQPKLCELIRKLK
jgi:hypothetical protein